MDSQTQLKPEYYTDFVKFATDLLEYNEIKKYEFGDIHKEIAGIIKRETNRYRAIVLPVGHLKTTWVSICYPIWRLVRESKYEICLVSATLSLSKKNMGDIQRLILDTPWLEYLAPKNREDTWSTGHIRTTNGNNLYIKAFKPSAVGIHPNEIIYDDILRDSDISMETIKDTFWHIFFPRGQTKQCKHTIIGTPMSADDLFTDIEKEATKGRWIYIKRPAIIYDEKGNRKPLWKERYTLEELDSIKDQMTGYRFAREYMCNPMAEGQGFFPTEMILNCTDDNLAFSYKTDGQTIIGADFAMSESATGDYNVFTVIEYSSKPVMRKMKYKNTEHLVKIEKPIIIKKIERYKGATGQVRRLIELQKQYQANKIILDSSAFGNRFAQELRENGVSVDAQDFRPSNRTQLLINLRRVIESDDPITDPPRLIIPTSEKDSTYIYTKVLLKELSGFNQTKTQAGYETIASSQEHDDTVMSLALAVKDAVTTRQTNCPLFCFPNTAPDINI